MELRFQVHAKIAKPVRDQRIGLDWEANEGGDDTHVEMSFERLDAVTTMVRIAECG
jgi:hypothetical protein